MWVVNYDEDGYLTRGNAADPSLGDYDVLVKVEASGVNRADLLQKVGKYPLPMGASPILGLEVAGEVVDVGKEGTRWKVGDRVMGLLAGGGYAEYVSDHENLFMRIPDGLSYEQASAVPEAFLTAYQALFSLANIATNEHVMIHAGASGVGMAAIQLAKSQGATVYVTAGSQSKIDFCQQIGADFGVNYRDTPLFEGQVLKLSDSHGIDIVVDVVGGSYVPQNINLLRT
ncbi:MAG: NADPH:quinone reductase-like Zn-dependent oxidoreductase, partial [Cyclobacteriaceae bacterium]